MKRRLTPVPLPPPPQAIRFTLDVNVDMRTLAMWPPEQVRAFLAGVAAVLAAQQGAR